MKTDRLLILFIILIAGAIYLNVTNYHLPDQWSGSHTPVPASGAGHVASGSLDNYPDVMVKLQFDSTPSDSIQRQINEYKSRYAYRYRAWISDMTLDTMSGKYIIGCDYQGTPYSEHMVHELTDSLYTIAGHDLTDISYE